MSLSDQENYEQPVAKRRKKAASTKPLALSQLSVMDISLTATRPTKRVSSVEVDTAGVKRVRSQTSQLSVYDDEDASPFDKSSAGVVKSVKLINFMCHAHFEIKFNPRINFISGCNGSGKSAIQTAMVIGLGGVASKTNRSSKIDGLIKHGTNFASVVIILSNTGWNAYKPEEYGNTIQITRNITPSSSSYKIHNQWGKAMASTKKELENILTRFRIQPNNPVSILNQDMARNFLSTNKAESKYALFRKATLLDEADELLSRLADEILEQEARIETKKRAIAQIQEEIDKMSKKMRLVEDLRLSKQKKFELENELAWSKVNNYRNNIEHLTNCRNEQSTAVDNLQADLNDLQAQEEQLTNQKRKFESDIVNIQEECRSREEAKQRLATQFRNLKRLYEDKCMGCETLESKLKVRKKNRAELKRSLDDTEKMDLEQKQRKEEAGRQRFNIQKELDVDESKMRVLEGEMTRLRTTADHYSENMAKQKRCMEDMRDQMEICQRRIRVLGNKNSDNLSMFEQWMPALVQKINEAVRNNKFSKPPRGPLGRYIKVKNEKWIYAIESNLGIALLNSFLVNSGNDRRVLYSIMDQVIRTGRKPTVHCSNFQEQNRDNELPKLETTYPGYSNMLRALTINDVVVTNFLMDYQNIQRILLVERDEDCRNFVKDDENIPSRCRLILNPDADQFLPGFKVYANQDRNRRAQILSKSAADQLRGLKEEVVEKEELIAQANQEIEKYRSDHTQCMDRIKLISRDIENLKSNIIRNKIKIRDINASIEIEVPSLQMKMDEIREIEEEIKEMEQKKQALIEERTEAQQKMSEAKNNMNVESQNDFFAQQTQLNLDKEKIARQLSAINMKISTVRSKISEQDKKMCTLEARIKDAEDKLANEEYTASQLSEEIIPQRTTSQIQQEIQQVETFISEAKKKLGAEETCLEKQYYDKKEKLFGFVGTFKELTSLHKHIKEMSAGRRELIGKLRDINASIIMAQFQTVLKSRNYKGTLKFDHATRKLDILMAPIDGGDTLMNTNSLSGGEKSYSTVAFLLALWSNMELPFYSMDEYDVFMDAINRKTITQLLMEFAQKKDNRQFIFLTPLDVSIIKPSPNVQVHKVNKIQN